MNTADKTLGTIDYALKRRFVDIYLPPNESELTDLVEIEEGISATDFLKKINTQLKAVLQNREFVIGQAVFYNDLLIEDGKFKWSLNKFENLMNYKIIPLIENYCNYDQNQVADIIGNKLTSRLSGDDFKAEIQNFIDGSN